MAFNDFLKKAKETAANAAEAAKNAAENAKAKYDEKRQEAAAQKEERERLRAEKQAAADAAAAELLEAMKAADGTALEIDSDKLLGFTAEFYDKLYLPAHSVSASKLIFHPLDGKIAKQAQKLYKDLTPGETPVFMILAGGHQNVYLSTKALYFRKTADEAGVFFSEGKLPIEYISDLSYTRSENSYVFACNGVELLSSGSGFELDTDSFAEYMRRIKERDLTVTNEQIDALIKSKIGSDILKMVREYIYDDELLLYFAWGCDSITAKDFIVCSDKQMVVLDRAAFGLTKNVKQFYYEDVTSMATLQETNGLLDLALTAALSVCDLEIAVAGTKERLSCLYTYEAEKVVKVYRECRRETRANRNQPVIVQQAAPAGDDPLAQLEKLNKLKEAGIITEEEFAEKKAALLAKL